MKIKSCIVCKKKKLTKYLNLGYQPLANNLSKNLNVAKYPLEVCFCPNCFHNQLSFEIKKEKLFSKYLYLSSQSKTLQNHFINSSKKYIKLFRLKKNSIIVDVGSNDGIGLKHFKERNFKNIYGIEPAKNVAKIANSNGIKTINSFLNYKISKRFENKVDLVMASNVFAHNKDIRNLLDLMIRMLKSNGVLVIEVQYLKTMLEKNLFDNIYHEHIHYWSINSLNYLFEQKKCSIVKIDKINTHGGSIRCYIKKNHIFGMPKNVKKLLKDEINYGLTKKDTYRSFSKKLKSKKSKFVEYLNKNKDKNIIGYGAAAKTTTILNYLKISDKIKHIIDDNRLKQNFYIPGTSIKIISRNKIDKNIDILVVFAWNYFSEIKKKN